MNVLKISSTNSGGAFIAAKRQSDALNRAGIACTLLDVEHDWSLEKSRYKLNPRDRSALLSPMMRKYKFADEFADTYFTQKRTSMSNSPMSIWRSNSEVNHALLALIKDGEFTHVHFHFAHPLLNSQLLESLAYHGIAVFITCHDMFYFTGGCHYSAQCERFKTECTHCPQLVSDQYTLIRHSFNEKRRAFENSRAHFVFPSEWMRNEFSSSSIGSQVPSAQLHTIRNCLDQSFFLPARRANQASLRIKLGIPPDTIVVLAGAIDNEEKRKGFDALKTTMLLASTELMREGSDRQFCLVTFGKAARSKPLKTKHVQQLDVGTLDSKGVRDLMQCADVLLFTSQQDNYPNIVLEAVHCGTLVLATHSGGTKELIPSYPHVTVNTGSITEDCRELAKLLTDSELTRRINKALVPSREFLLQNSPDSVAQALAETYQEAVR